MAWLHPVLCLSAAVVLSLWMGTDALAQEQNQVPLGEKAASAIEALNKARAYAMDTGGVAVLIRYGQGNGASAEAIGQAFVTEIRKRQWAGKYFYYDADWQGMSVEYHIYEVSMGPYSANDAAGHMSKAVSMAQAAWRVHNQGEAVLSCTEAEDMERCMADIRSEQP